MRVPKTFTLRCGDRNHTQEAATGTHVLSDDLHHERRQRRLHGEADGQFAGDGLRRLRKLIKGANKGRARDKVNAALAGFGTDWAPRTGKRI
jgi:hypothetical protein